MQNPTSGGENQSKKRRHKEDHQAGLPAEHGADHRHQRYVAEAHRLFLKDGGPDDAHRPNHAAAGSQAHQRGR